MGSRGYVQEVLERVEKGSCRLTGGGFLWWSEGGLEGGELKGCGKRVLRLHESIA